MNLPSQKNPSPILDLNDYKKKVIIKNNYNQINIPITFIIFVCINITVFIGYLWNNIIYF